MCMINNKNYEKLTSYQKHQDLSFLDEQKKKEIKNLLSRTNFKDFGKDTPFKNLKLSNIKPKDPVMQLFEINPGNYYEDLKKKVLKMVNIQSPKDLVALVFQEEYTCYQRFENLGETHYYESKLLSFLSSNSQKQLDHDLSELKRTWNCDGKFDENVIYILKKKFFIDIKQSNFVQQLLILYIIEHPNSSFICPYVSGIFKDVKDEISKQLSYLKELETDTKPIGHLLRFSMEIVSKVELSPGIKIFLNMLNNTLNDFLKTNSQMDVLLSLFKILKSNNVFNQIHKNLVRKFAERILYDIFYDFPPIGILATMSYEKDDAIFNEAKEIIKFGPLFRYLKAMKSNINFDMKEEYQMEILSEVLITVYRKIGELCKTDLIFPNIFDIAKPKILQKESHQPSSSESDSETSGSKKKININENLSENFSNLQLRDYKIQSAIYSTDGNKVLIEWATFKYFTTLLFIRDNMEPGFINLHIFAWHNSRDIKSSKILNLFEDILVNCKDGKPIIDGLPTIKHEYAASIIFIYLQRWVSIFPKDFAKLQDDSVLTEIFEHIKDYFNIDEIKEIIESAVINSKRKKHIPKEKLEERSDAEFLNEVKIDALKHTLAFSADSMTVAKHIMFNQLSTYRNINCREYVNCSWTKNKHAPHLIEITTNFNHLSQYIQYTIVNFTKKDPKATAFIIAQWILIMEKCRIINNFQGLFVIESALSSPSVAGLHKCWDALNEITVPGSDLKIKEIYGALSLICSPLRKFKNYKTLLINIDESLALPFIGPWLTDMAFINDGSTRFKNVEGNELMNVTMHRAYWMVCLFLRKDWGTNCSFKISKQILEIIKHKTDTGYSPSDLQKMSLECEPK
ncbi:RasGEF domain containing protein [Trichomonas vaginalis G3]|uniref:RasGEF domain containing protein n=1 Tax=Trichomonas vaginalis (strain ATCC PRA-98 / G3) TaxID=412133 RepID=A2F534_TRIV3|nr:guanyl-nucleotide exchange factor protein [Trichomonas vaginalis G3]EAX99977.1 RasGEF domain containing protein [Trichomonas vaginalis G3]KAI5519789.1 guanyl-nucleotide exchange factor protein [Trichomonas vaginalis G3]|eukprot:XP_001312907.1 RasGEF domain containing protein [Trichomonas vaginalis G3]